MYSFQPKASGPKQKNLKTKSRVTPPVKGCTHSCGALGGMVGLVGLFSCLDIAVEWVHSVVSRSYKLEF